MRTCPIRHELIREEKKRSHFLDRKVRNVEGGGGQGAHAYLLLARLSLVTFGHSPFFHTGSRTGSARFRTRRDPGSELG